MSPTRLITPLLLAALWLAASPAGADASTEARYRLKKGAAGKVCLSCHVDFEEIVALPHVHTPVKAGDCANCHDPHASDHGKLLAQDPDAICASCHADVVPDEPRSFHPAAVEGNCVACHDPHGSQHENNLRAAGRELCATCHGGLISAVTAAQVKHRPVEGDCLGCHTPHASAENDALLSQSVPGLCVSCHDTSRSTFVKDHRDYPVAESDCTSCHDPHGSPRRGILWAGVHSPVERGMCAQCHSEAGTPTALETKRPGAELCRGCHNDTFNETFAARSRLHWPLVDQRACSNCHTPHGSKNASLLTEPQGKLCGGCHADAVRRQGRSTTEHPPVAEGECGSCHAPHASDEAFLLLGDLTVVCGACHDWERHSAHPMGEKAIDPRNQNLSVDCLSCHRTHGTSSEKLAHFDPRQDLCVQCHTGVTR